MSLTADEKAIMAYAFAFSHDKEYVNRSLEKFRQQYPTRWFKDPKDEKPGKENE